MIKADTLSRRRFLKHTAWIGSTLFVGAPVLGAHEEVRITVFGLGNKGRGHVRQFSGMRSVRIVAVCDVDPERLGHPDIRAVASADTVALKDAMRTCRQAEPTIEKLERHLLANGVDLAKEPMTCGPWLTVDPRTEGILEVAGTDDGHLDQARRLARGFYRAPFVMPKAL